MVFVVSFSAISATYENHHGIFFIPLGVRYCRVDRGAAGNIIRSLPYTEPAVESEP